MNRTQDRPNSPCVRPNTRTRPGPRKPGSLVARMDRASAAGGSALNPSIPAFRARLVYGFCGLPSSGIELRRIARKAMPGPSPTNPLARMPTQTVRKTSRSSRNLATKRPRPSPPAGRPRTSPPRAPTNESWRGVQRRTVDSTGDQDFLECPCSTLPHAARDGCATDSAPSATYRASGATPSSSSRAALSSAIVLPCLRFVLRQRPR